MSIATRTLNRIKRLTSLISENAKLATPGPWEISHSHVHAYGKDKTGKLLGFNIASPPYDCSSPCVYGDMRHIATCQPRTMLMLVEDVNALLAERDSIAALCERLDDLINNGGTMDGVMDERTRALGEAVENYLGSEP